MKDIIIDTNFFLIPAEFKVDIFSEIDRICHFPYRLCVVRGTEAELESLAAKERGKERESAKLGLQMLRAWIKGGKIAVLEGESPPQSPPEKQKSLYTPGNSSGLGVDDIIVSVSDENTIVATQDKGLKKRLREKFIKIITLRNKSHLEMI